MTDQTREEKGFQRYCDVVKILTGVIVLWVALAAGMLLIRLIGEQRLRRFMVVLPAWKRVSHNR
jgi:sorbitol-specific phosphotransferase system component IIC